MKQKENTGFKVKIKQFGVLMTVLLLVLLLVGCGPTVNDGADIQDAEGTQDGQNVAEELSPPENGDPSNVTCKGTYTVADESVPNLMNNTVATIGEYTLTNGALQVYYWMEVAAYREAGHDVAPDFTKPLDVQLCDIDDTAITWQQYFLQRALDNWHSRQALAIWGAETPLELEEAYQPYPSQHEEYLDPALPALKYLYGYYNDYYEPNEMHQGYLDDLPTILLDMAKKNGYTDLDAQLLDMAGVGATSEYLEQYAYLYNWCYMYYTQLTYDMKVTEEDITAYYEAHSSDYADHRGYTVDIRHVLLVPEGVENEDGTVAPVTEEDWERCRADAEKMLEDWRKNTKKEMNWHRKEHSEEREFGELANANSKDVGTASNGGLLSDVRKGQLIKELDSWCFDAARVPGDIELIRTKSGWHIVYFVGTEDAWYEPVKQDMLEEASEQVFLSAMAAHEMIVDYSAIALGSAAQSGEVITPDDVLYADIAHERFPVAPLYLQRDYPTTKYGNYPVHTYGCGVTTMAMLASYLTDEEWTVPELCEMYGTYCFKTGTDYSMYDNVPCELGFYGIRRSMSWDEVAEALEKGQACISMQRGGYWTRRGHFILMQNFTEDGLVVVRDSNILNYASIKNHMIDAHEVKSITAQSALYWICQDKVTRSGSCSRCDNTNHAGADMSLLTSDWYCERCIAATTRRGNFVSAMEHAIA